MVDREKVIKGLECCIPMTLRNGLADCGNCPYDRKITIDGGITECCHDLMTDALALLKAQETEAADAPKPDSDIWCWYDITHNYTSEQVVSALKAQNPQVMTLDEIHDSMVVYLEAGTKFLGIVDDDGVVLAIGGSERTVAKCFITVWDVNVCGMNDEYNVTWRAWSQRPTKEQREREPWNSRANDDER